MPPIAGPLVHTTAVIGSPTDPPDPAINGDMIFQYTTRSTTLNDCHLGGLTGPFQFNKYAIGSSPWTKTGAIENPDGTGDALFLIQSPQPTGCVGWVNLTVHSPSGRSTMSGGARCPDGQRSCGFQTEGTVNRVR